MRRRDIISKVRLPLPRRRGLAAAAGDALPARECSPGSPPRPPAGRQWEASSDWRWRCPTTLPEAPRRSSRAAPRAAPWTASGRRRRVSRAWGGRGGGAPSGPSFSSARLKSNWTRHAVRGWGGRWAESCSVVTRLRQSEAGQKEESPSCPRFSFSAAIVYSRLSAGGAAVGETAGSSSSGAAVPAPQPEGGSQKS